MTLQEYKIIKAEIEANMFTGAELSLACDEIHLATMTSHNKAMRSCLELIKNHVTRSK